MKRRTGTGQWNAEIDINLIIAAEKDAVELQVKKHEWTTAAFEHYLAWRKKQSVNSAHEQILKAHLPSAAPSASTRVYGSAKRVVKKTRNHPQTSL